MTELLTDWIDLLAELEIPYMVVGWVSSSLYHLDEHDLRSWATELKLELPPSKEE